MSFEDKYYTFLDKTFGRITPESIEIRAVLAAVFTLITALATLYLATQSVFLAVPFMWLTIFNSYGFGKLLTVKTFQDKQNKNDKGGTKE